MYGPPPTLPPAADPIEALKRDMSELRAVVIEATSKVIELVHMLRLTQLGQLAVEAKIMKLEEDFSALQERLAVLEHEHRGGVGDAQ